MFEAKSKGKVSPRNPFSTALDDLCDLFDRFVVPVALAFKQPSSGDMAPKQKLEKEAWEWAEKTEPESITRDNIETAFRLHLKSCKKGSCRRNCKGNPLCLNGLGEKVWLGEIPEENWHDIEDPNSDRRKEGSFVGLKNLGATCYVSTFIQVWFHNPEFRSAIYKWYDTNEANKKATGCGDVEVSFKAEGNEKDQPGSEEGGGEKNIDLHTEDEKTLMPSSVCGHLQLVFALLHFSNRSFIDPSPLINCLGLDAGLQQDAQEFSKLFMSVLEDELLQQSDSTVKNMIQRCFSGKYSYVTQCNKCNGRSQRPSKFYELDLNIKGHKDLKECVEEFLEEEKLDGDNQYFCSYCNSKQNATRKIQLESLPPVLNLQLLRFVFDRTTGHKKKLNTFIQFPEVLDMSAYMKPTKTGAEAVPMEPDTSQSEGVFYDLTSVLIHRGPSAYSGHYVAHIRDYPTGTWFKFNDEEIEKMAGKNLQLGNEEDMQGGGGKKPRTAKGFHASRNAYMLVYQKRTENKQEYPEPELSSLPERVQKFVKLDNKRFENWVIEMTSMRDSNVENGKARQNEIKHMYNLLHKDGPKEAISTSWFSKWLAETSSKDGTVVDNGDLLCGHGKLDPEKSGKMKWISEEAAEIIYTKYQGGPRLKSDSLCENCVRERCKEIRTKSKLDEDSKVIAAVLKAKDIAEGTEDCYWVGKASLRSWKRLVMEKLKENENHTVSMETDSLQDAQSSSDTVKKEEDESVTQDENNEETIGFNEDLLCEKHNKLTTEHGVRRLIPADIWQRLRTYFPTAPEFRHNAPTCETCVAQEEEERERLEMNKMLAHEQKSKLLDLYLDRSRPVWKKEVPQLNVVSKEFLEVWKKFVKDSSKNEPVTEMTNRQFLCDHGGFMLHPETIGLTEASQSIVYIWPKEWEILTTFVKADVEILLSRIEEDTGQITFLVTPDLCEECCNAKVEAEMQQKLNYKNATIFIRKLTEDQKNSKSVNSSCQSLNETPSLQENFDKEDPEFTQENGKRKKSSDDVDLPEKIARIESSTRRSSRHRKVRGEKEATLSSSNTLRDLKLQIMKLFSVAPFDQNLSFNGQELTNDKATLADLCILPQSVIYLKADEPCEDPTFLDEVTSASCHPEQGFKGTSLLGR